MVEKESGQAPLCKNWQVAASVQTSTPVHDDALTVSLRAQLMQTTELKHFLPFSLPRAEESPTVSLYRVFARSFFGMFIQNQRLVQQRLDQMGLQHSSRQALRHMNTLAMQLRAIGSLATTDNHPVHNIP